jgi:hypothetical protein
MWTLADLLSDGAPPPSLREVADGNASVPVLVIAADTPGERAVAADLAERSPLFEIWQTSGIGHVESLNVAPGEWRLRVLEFLDRELLDDR